MPPIPLALVLLLSLAPPVLGQERPPLAPALPDSVIGLMAQAKLPLRPLGAAHWTSMRGAFKARCDQVGVTLFPLRGPDRPHTPLRWATTRVVHGGQELPLDTIESLAASDWRWEIRRVGMIEAYDVLDSGLEQTFVVPAGSPLGGDLVIEGELTTDLLADPYEGHGEIVFRADGEAVARYGAATAVAADGSVLPLRTVFDGRKVTLRVPAAWLSAAAYPVVVDPLLGPTNLRTGGGFSGVPIRAQQIHVASDQTGATNNSVLITYVEPVSLFDSDAFAVLCNHDFTQPVVVFSDVDTQFVNWVAAAASTARWAICYVKGEIGWRYSQPIGSRVYMNGAGPFDETTSMLPPASRFGWTSFSSWSLDSFDVAGSVVGAELLVAGFTVRNQALSAFGLVARVVGASGLPEYLDATYPSDLRAASFSLNRVGDASGWLVVGARAAGGSRAYRLDLQGRVNPARPRWDLANAGVTDGIGDTYLLLVPPASVGGPYRAQRLSWGSATGLPVIGPLRDLAIASGSTGLGSAVPCVDIATRSHWCIAAPRAASAQWNIELSRVGYDLVTAETHLVTAVSVSGLWLPYGICYSRAAGGAFLLTVAPSQTSTAQGYRLSYPSDAGVTAYGSSCGGAIQSITPPYAGHVGFQMTMRYGALSGVAGAILLGASPASIPLDTLGMPSCVQLVASPISLALPPSDQGVWTAAFALPSTLYGDVHAQFVHAAPSLNQLGVATSNGLVIRVR